MITTKDNPYNPFKDFTSWFLFDISKGYNTCSKLARISNISFTETEIERVNSYEKAIDRLIELDFIDIYKKIYEN